MKTERIGDQDSNEAAAVPAEVGEAGGKTLAELLAADAAKKQDAAKESHAKAKRLAKQAVDYKELNIKVVEAKGKKRDGQDDLPKRVRGALKKEAVEQEQELTARADILREQLQQAKDLPESPEATQAVEAAEQELKGLETAIAEGKKFFAEKIRGADETERANDNRFYEMREDPRKNAVESVAGLHGLKGEGRREFDGEVAKEERFRAEPGWAEDIRANLEEFKRKCEQTGDEFTRAIDKTKAGVTENYFKQLVAAAETATVAVSKVDHFWNSKKTKENAKESERITLARVFSALEEIKSLIQQKETQVVGQV